MRSEGNYHDAGFGVSNERNELVERGRREVSRKTTTTPVSECRTSGMSSSRGAVVRSEERPPRRLALDLGERASAWRGRSSSWRCYLILSELSSNLKNHIGTHTGHNNIQQTTAKSERSAGGWVLGVRAVGIGEISKNYCGVRC